MQIRFKQGFYEWSIFSSMPIYETYSVLQFLLLSDHDNRSKHGQIYSLLHATCIGRDGLKYEQLYCRNIIYTINTNVKDVKIETRKHKQIDTINIFIN